MNKLGIFREDVASYREFLLDMGIDLMSGNVSLELLMIMFQFSDIQGDASYRKAICYYLHHLIRNREIEIITGE
jgi:hypothetical protein